MAKLQRPVVMDKLSSSASGLARTEISYIHANIFSTSKIGIYGCILEFFSHDLDA
jgi:hypothetical protein